MNRTSLVLLSFVLAGSTLAIAGSAPAAPAPAPDAPALGELIMDGHDAGHILYADRCSNGGNSDDAGRAKFIAAMRADRRSKLAQTIAAAEARFIHDKRFHEIDLGEWFTTYHLRDGCGETSISVSAPIYLLSKMSNTHELQTKYLVTLDDNVVADRRTFRLRSIVPLALRTLPRGTD
jgi:hypothetical protein